MDSKKFLMGTLIGGVVLFLLGYLFYGVLLASFFESHSSAANVMKDPPDFLFLILGNLASGALLSYIFNKWAGIKTASTGMQAGAIIGLLTALGWDLSMYATTNMGDITMAITDVIVVGIMSAAAGGAIGWYLGRK